MQFHLQNTHKKKLISVACTFTKSAKQINPNSSHAKMMNYIL